MGDEAFPDALPLHHRFHWYELERVLGQGGFGITYLARDTNLDQAVAIKEYLPSDFAHRRSDAMVCARTGPLEERYRWGLERFLIEARTLARFDHPNIVRVLTVFEANGTAYMVMRFEAGENLGALLERRGTLSEPELLRILLPVLDGLDGVHAAGFIHRDIKPENIHIRNDGSPVLLDFGSARQLLGRAKNMTILVAPGYAALEQYYGDAANQGPWTDIYGLGATAYRAIAGVAPVDAIARTKGVLGSTRETMRAAVDVGRGRYHDQLLAAIDHALRLNETDRPQSLAQWRAAISASVIPAHAGVQGRGAGLEPRASQHEAQRGEAQARPVAPLVLAKAQTKNATTAPSPRELPALREARRGLPGRTLPWTLGGAAVATLAAGAWWWAAPTHWPSSSVATAPAPVISPSSNAVPDPALASEPERSPSAPIEAPAVSQSTAAPFAGAVTPAANSIPSTTTPGRGLPSPPKQPSTRPTAASPAPAPEGGAVPPVAHDVARAPAPASAPLPFSPSAETTSAPAPPAGPAPQPVPATPAHTPPPAAGDAPIGVAEIRPNVAPAPAPPKADDPLDMAVRAIRQGDHKRAIELLEPLGQRGDSRAQTLLGEQYEHGRGAPQSDFQAYIWYSLAARRSSNTAVTAKARVAARLQPAEVQQGDHQAERLAEQWRRNAAGGQK